jgi:PII-like signaling protein
MKPFDVIFEAVDKEQDIRHFCEIVDNIKNLLDCITMDYLETFEDRDKVIEAIIEILRRQKNRE